MRQERGARAYHAGLAAEDMVARDYEVRGHAIQARRFRGASGEIDLIAIRDDEVVFVEVKQARSHDAAAYAVSPRQLKRIFRTANEYLAQTKSALETLSRVDIALVDGFGDVQYLENVQLN